jgi:hypothetical protein
VQEYRPTVQPVLVQVGGRVRAARSNDRSEVSEDVDRAISSVA